MSLHYCFGNSGKWDQHCHPNPTWIPQNSSILLLALAVTDVLFLIGINNIPMYIYVANVPQGFLYSETTNYVLYIISLVFFCAYTLGLQCGMVIPSLITGERILTIFFPLKNNFILTRRRTIIAVWFLYIVNGWFFCVPVYTMQTV